MSIYDWIFAISAVLFNLLIAGIFVTQKYQNARLTKIFGISWLLLFFPLLAVFLNYVSLKKPDWVLVCLGLVFVYMIVELLLDYVFNYDFRKSWSTHVPYILLEYAALFSLIAVAIETNELLGWVVSICFWILMGCLIFLYAGKKKPKAQP